MELPETLPTIEAPNVNLRPFRYDDVPLVLSVGTDPAVTGTTTVPSPGDPEAARAFIDRQNGRLDEGLGCSFAIADAATDGGVGQIGLWVHGMRDGRASVGYWVGPEHRRRGRATDALVALSGWALTLPGLHRLELYVEPGNEGSARTALGAGFTCEGVLRSWQEVAGVRRDMEMYSLLPGEVAS